MPLQGVLHDDLTSGPVGIAFAISNFPYAGLRNTTFFDGWWECLSDTKVRLAKWAQSHGNPFFQKDSQWYHFQYRSTATLHKNSSSTASCATSDAAPAVNYCVNHFRERDGNPTQVLPEVNCTKR